MTAFSGSGEAELGHERWGGTHDPSSGDVVAQSDGRRSEASADVMAITKRSIQRFPANRTLRVICRRWYGVH
jgi:hypothetical protein